MDRGLPDVIRRRFDPAGRYGLRATLFGFAVVLTGVPFGLLLAQVVQSGPLVRLDTSAARALHEWIRGKPLTITVLKVITFVGTPQFFFIICAIIVVFLFRHQRYRLMSFLLVTSLGGGLIDSVVKILVDRDRPNLEQPLIPLHGKSFPSGHAMSSTFVYGAILLIFIPAIKKRWRPHAIGAWIVLVLAIGFSRLALGVHYITDVVGGYVLGLAWLAASTAAFSIWREERGRKPVHPTKGLEPEAAPELRPHTKK